jgi:chromate reductase
VALNVPTMPQPEAYLGHADELFGMSGKLADERARQLLQNFMKAFAAWISANAVSVAADLTRRAG